jgi:hypothetical protein
MAKTKTKKPEHEFYPAIEGASIPLRGYAEKVNDDGTREGRLQFTLAHATGEIDGVTFDVGGGMDCSIRVTFKRRGAKDDHTYYVNVRDVVEAAFAADKRRHGRKS